MQMIHFEQGHCRMQPLSWVLRSALWTSRWMRSSSSILQIHQQMSIGREKRETNRRTTKLTPSLECPSDARARPACSRWPPALRGAVSRAASGPLFSASLRVHGTKIFVRDSYFEKNTQSLVVVWHFFPSQRQSCTELWFRYDRIFITLKGEGRSALWEPYATRFCSLRSFSPIRERARELWGLRGNL